MTNRDRAKMVNTAVSAFKKLTKDNDNETTLADLLCNLMHWADTVGVDFVDIMGMARANYTEEIVEEIPERFRTEARAIIIKEWRL